MQEDAALKIEFGRKIVTDRIILYTRADFPHDNWWKQVTITFSNGEYLEVNLQKSSQPHEILFEEKQITWVELSKLIKSEEPSPFPALSQIELYGMDP